MYVLGSETERQTIGFGFGRSSMLGCLRILGGGGGGGGGKLDIEENLLILAS